MIDPARAAEVLQIGARYQAAEAMANQVNAAAADVAAQKLFQAERPRDQTVASGIVVRQDLIEAVRLQVAFDRQERRGVREQAVHEHDRPLLFAAPGRPDAPACSEGE